MTFHNLSLSRPLTKLFRRPLVVALVMSLCSVGLGRGQSPIPVGSLPLEIKKIIVSGNEAIETDKIKELLSLRETPSGFSQFLYLTLGETFGSKPEFFDFMRFENDQQRLKKMYEEHGFYQNTIKAEYSVDTLHREATLVFMIHEGKRSLIDSVMYAGLEKVPQEVAVHMYTDALLYPGMPYESERAAAEVRRILIFLGNAGYPQAKFDLEHSAAYHHAYSSNNFDLRLQFALGVQQHFGDINIQSSPPREDITSDLVLRQLDFHTGDVYSREKKATSARSLNRLGLFETATIDTLPVADTVSSVPMVVNVRPRPRNELTPEIIVSDENYAFNLGLGLGYTNRNFLGDARSFIARTRTRTQSIQDWNFSEVFGGRGLSDSSVVGAVELQFEVLQPYLFTRTLSGSWSSSISAEKQRFFTLSILRNKIGLANQFATFTYGYLDWTLERVNPEINPDILSDTTRVQAVLSVLRREDQPQFNSILTATLQRDNTNDIFSPSDGVFNSVTLEESGILPKLFPGVVGSLPFTQYYKITLLERWYHDLTSSRFNILAVKVKTGYQDKYGGSRSLPVTIPLNRRFFAGGSGSVRGWKARELGAMTNDLLQLGGNFIFEGNVELRVNHFRGFGKAWFLKLENIWGVYFLDLGNVWSDITDFKPKDIAVATGIGFRYETFFGPFRIDYGFRVYDPKAEGGRQTIFQKRFFGETLPSGVFHFGIGHAF